MDKLLVSLFSVGFSIVWAAEYRNPGRDVKYTYPDSWDISSPPKGPYKDFATLVPKKIAGPNRVFTWITSDEHDAFGNSRDACMASSEKLAERLTQNGWPKWTTAAWIPVEEKGVPRPPRPQSAAGGRVVSAVYRDRSPSQIWYGNSAEKLAYIWSTPDLFNPMLQSVTITTICRNSTERLENFYIVLGLLDGQTSADMRAAREQILGSVEFSSKPTLIGTWQGSGEIISFTKNGSVDIANTGLSGRFIARLRSENSQKAEGSIEFKSYGKPVPADPQGTCEYRTTGGSLVLACARGTFEFYVR